MIQFLINFKWEIKMRILLAISLFLLFQSVSLFAQEPDKKPAFIFAAGNLKFIFPQIIKKFYATYPDARVFIQYGSSGYLADSILEGKSYDIFFSADTIYPQKVYNAKKSATKPTNYTQGILILFTPPNTLLSEKKIKILNSKDIEHITIANKSTSPYGIAAIQTLQNSKCCKNLMDKIRYSSDVATAIDNVIWRGDAGFLSKSALYMIPENRRKEGVDWIEIDKELYSPIIQAYVISKHGLINVNAVKFLHFLNSPTGQKIFRENGYISLDSN